jgi:O-antigen/teichoic acid export membrane protein
VVFVGNLVARGFGFLFPVVVARLLDRPDFAVASLLISTGFFAGELVLTGFPTAMTRALAAERDTAARSDWIVGAIIGGLPLLALSAVLGVLLAVQADAPPGLLVIVVIGLTVDAYYFALLRGVHQFSLLAIYRVAANVVQLLLLLVLAVTHTAGLEIVVVIYGLVYLVPIAIIELVAGPGRHAIAGRFQPTLAQLRTLTAFAIPSLISGTAYGAILGFDVYFVNQFAPEALADYAAARSLAVPMLLVPFALAVVLLPQAAAAPRTAQGRLLGRALAITALASAAGWAGYIVLGEFLIGHVFPATYARATEPLVTLVPAIALLGTYSVLSQWTLGIGRPWTAAICLSAGALVTLGGHATLTASLGSVGAGIAIALGAGTALVLIGISTWRWLRTPAPAVAPAPDRALEEAAS